MKKTTIDELGWLERGNGKTQSNVVYSVGGGSRRVFAPAAE